MQKDTLDKIITMIGRADDWELRQIIDASNRRLKDMRARDTYQAISSINIGDIVELRDIRPKYMSGARATVTDRKGTKFVVSLHDGLKFRGRSSVITVPASCVTKIVTLENFFNQKED